LVFNRSFTEGGAKISSMEKGVFYKTPENLHIYQNNIFYTISLIASGGNQREEEEETEHEEM